MATTTTHAEPNSTDSVTSSSLSSAESVHEPISLLYQQQNVGACEGAMVSGAIHSRQSITRTSASGTMPLPEVAGSPVWSHGSALMDDLTRTCSTSPSTHGWVAAGESPQISVPSSSHQHAPLASIHESNHIADSPSPPSSTRKARTSQTSHSSERTDINSDRTDMNNNYRPGARVRLEDLFDVEAGVDSCHDPSIVSDTFNVQCTGYLNPVAVFSDFEVTSSTVDAMDCKKCESQSLIPCDLSSWKQSNMAGRAYQSPSATSFNTVSSEGPICRICHEGDQAGESLISPCRCTGTLQYLHTKCLEQWLQTRNKDNCELCNFEFHTRRRTRPLIEWWRHPTNPRDRRNLGVDVVCGAILSPLVMISAWLCLNGSRHYMHHEERSLEGMGLILLAAVLLAIFMTWSLLTGRYHYMVWREWSKHNQLVIVLTTPKTPPKTPSPPVRSRNEILHERIDNNGFIGFVRIPAHDSTVSSNAA